MRSCTIAKAIESLHEKNSSSFCCHLQKVAEGLTIFSPSLPFSPPAQKNEEGKAEKAVEVAP